MTSIITHQQASYHTDKRKRHSKVALYCLSQRALSQKQANRWEAAHKLASSYMSEGEVRVLYMEQAQKMEAGGSLLEAEKLYLQVGEV